jgi:hypothetical protein
MSTPSRSNTTASINAASSKRHHGPVRDKR